MGRVLTTQGAHLTAAVTLSLAAAAARDAEPVNAVVLRPAYEPDDIRPAIGRYRDDTAPRSPRQSFKKSSKR